MQITYYFALAADPKVSLRRGDDMLDGGVGGGADQPANKALQRHVCNGASVGRVEILCNWQHPACCGRHDNNFTVDRVTIGDCRHQGVGGSDWTFDKDACHGTCYSRGIRCSNKLCVDRTMTNWLYHRPTRHTIFSRHVAAKRHLFLRKAYRL